MTDGGVAADSGSLRDLNHEEGREESSETLTDLESITLHHADGHVVVNNGILLREEAEAKVEQLVDETGRGAGGLANGDEIVVQVAVVENVDGRNGNINPSLNLGNLETGISSFSLTLSRETSVVASIILDVEDHLLEEGIVCVELGDALGRCVSGILLHVYEGLSPEIKMVDEFLSVLVEILEDTHGLSLGSGGLIIEYNN